MIFVFFVTSQNTYGYLFSFFNKSLGFIITKYYIFFSFGKHEEIKQKTFKKHFLVNLNIKLYTKTSAGRKLKRIVTTFDDTL